MSMSVDRSGGVRSFQHSAALPEMPKKQGTPTASSRKEVRGKLPSINNGSLPSIHSPLNKRESVEVAPAPAVKRSLAPMDDNNRTKERKHRKRHKDGTETPAQDSNNNEDERGSSKKDRKAEEKQMVKDQVNVALKAVRDVFKTPKGHNILVLETKVERARQNDSYVVTKVKRKGETDSLGISFTIPARVMALGWESGQHLVVTDVTPKPGVKSALEIGDIVVAVDGAEVHSIEDLKVSVNGKKKMKFQCIRDSEDVTDEELAETQARIEKGLKAAVKAKVKESMKARRKNRH